MKKTKRKSLIEAELQMQRLLKRVGYTGKYKDVMVNEIPDYRTDSLRYTSNIMPAQGPKKEQKVYTGDELLGLSTMHKSNTVPIRKDNKQAAIDASQMRRN